MFLKMSYFKTLLKNAWQGAGLVVGNDGEGIYLCGTYWSIWLERTMMTKKAKAAIVELAGELPGEGQVFKCWKGQENQYELKKTYEEDYYNPYISGFKTRYKETGVSFKEFGISGKILQDKDNLQCVVAPEFICDMVDVASMEKYESHPEGPYGKYELKKESNIIYWQNEACTLSALTTTVTEDSKQSYLLECMRRYNYTEGKKAE